MKIKAIFAFLSVVLVLALTPATPMAESSSSSSALTSKIDYWFVGHLGQTDDEGRLLVWDATIEGDVT